MAVGELRKMLDSHKLPSAGTKAELVARLQRHSMGASKKVRMTLCYYIYIYIYIYIELTR